MFPPGWNINVGNPHLALPLLKAAMQEEGVHVSIRDLNWEIAEYFGVRITLKDAAHANNLGSIEAMNIPYFNAEDNLMEVARTYGGEWNIQLGFKFTNLSFYFSKDVREALAVNSPFTKYFQEEILPWVQREDPNIIGFSIASIYQIIPALHLSWMLRKTGYSELIVLGGNTISRLKEEIVKAPWLFDFVDGFIVFQGELPFLRFVKCVEKKAVFTSVPNLLWRDESVVRENPVIQSVDPNLMPTPNFGELPVGQYWGVNYLPLLAARGCYYGKCSFCSIPYGYGSGGFSGIRNSDLVFTDMIALKEKHGIHRFKFMDEALPLRTMIELSNCILKEDVQVEWEGYLRLERRWFDRAFVNRLAISGFKKGYFGLEIYPGESRSNLKKNDNAEEILLLLKKCHDAGIMVHLFCMFGFPGTGRIEAERTVEFILKHRNLIDTVDINAYTYARHTSVYGIEKIVKPGHDWALEYDYRPTVKDVLSSCEVKEITAELEDIIWTECPRLLHPTYRLASPWEAAQPFQDVVEEEYASTVVP